MNHAFEIAGVGLSTQQRALDVIANNIANINTLGFKRSDVRFVELIASAYDPSAASAQASGPFALAGVSARPNIAIDVQGEIEQSGRALDIAIEGSGFIEVMGPRGQTLLWRGGSMRVGADGMLAAADGLTLQAMISLPEDASEVEIDRDGVVRVRTSGSEEMTEAGQILLTLVDDASSLERVDGGLFRPGDMTTTRAASPGDEGAGEFVQGGLERSNVELTDEMVRLMLVQRAYTANAQIVQAADQLMAIANNLRK